MRSASHTIQAVSLTVFMALELNSSWFLPLILSCVKFVEFETYSVPDEVYLSRFSLAGLVKPTWPATSPVEELIMDPCLPLSPVKMPSGNEYILKYFKRYAQLSLYIYSSFSQMQQWDMLMKWRPSYRR